MDVLDFGNKMAHLYRYEKISIASLMLPISSCPQLDENQAVKDVDIDSSKVVDSDPNLDVSIVETARRVFTSMSYFSVEGQSSELFVYAQCLVTFCPDRRIDSVIYDAKQHQYYFIKGLAAFKNCYCDTTRIMPKKFYNEVLSLFFS
jgi:hypothetical protein